MKKPLFILFIAILLMAAGVASVIGYVAYDFMRTAPSSTASEIIYEVYPNKGFNTIAKELEQKGVVRSAFLMTALARVTGMRGKVKVGEYALTTAMLPNQILEIITSGKSIERPFTFAEGLNIYEVAAKYEKDGFGKSAEFLALCKDAELIKRLTGETAMSLEGYLFPETYQLTKFTDTKSLITSMVRRFDLVFAEVEKQKKITNLSKREIITLASIIEKETGAPEERTVISSVFHNRMKKGMKLQTDPTIIYGIADETGVIPEAIRKADILRPTRYNTYVIDGLPPGPIANPGRDALFAALNPQETNYLFFVSQNEGRHQFSETYEAHNQAVRKYQLDPKAREGKSWRDLNKPKK